MSPVPPSWRRHQQRQTDVDEQWDTVLFVSGANGDTGHSDAWRVDAWMDKAEFTVSVDGKQTGGVMTTTALHSQAADGQQLGGIQSVTALNANGGSQAFSFQDALAAASHKCPVLTLAPRRRTG